LRPFTERVLWSFEVPSENTSVVGFTSLIPSNKAKAAHWARAILNTEAKSVNWGPAELEGRKCRIYVEESKDSEGFDRNVVTRVMTAKAQGQSEEDLDDDIPF
jgi:hypothetical protein